MGPAKRAAKAAAQVKGPTAKAETVADARSRRTLRRNNTGSIVQRILNEQFGDLTDAEKDAVKYGGLTLRERLCKDKSEQRHGSDGTVSMGKKYYEARRAEYGQNSSGKSALEVKDHTEVPNDKLLTAVREARQSAPQRSGLYDWLSNYGDDLLQSEMVGLGRFFLELKPWSSDQNLKLSVAMLRFWVRVDAETTYPEEMTAIRGHIDKTLVAAWSSMKSANIKVPVFWSAYKDVAKFVVSCPQVDQLLDASDFNGLGEVLEIVTSSSQLGMSMFGWALYAHQVARCSAIIEDEVAKLLLDDITEKSIKTVSSAVMKSLAKLPGSERLNVVRVVGMTYCGDEIKVQVDTLAQEVHFKIAALVKSASMSMYVKGEGYLLLEPLYCETSLHGPMTKFGHKIDASLLKQYQLARTTANGMLPDADQANGLFVKNAIETKLAVLTQIDDSFVLEAAWFLHMHAEGGHARLEAELLKPLPTEAGVTHDAKLAANALGIVKQSRLYTFVAPQHQASFNVGVEMVKAVASDRLPSIKAVEGNKTLMAVLDRLSFFVHYSKPISTGSSTPPEVLPGKAALAAKLRDIHNEKAAGEKITPERLREFHTFNWLLSPEDKASHNKLIKEAFSGAKGAKPGADAPAKGTKRKADEKTAGEKRMAAEESTLNLLK